MREQTEFLLYLKMEDLKIQLSVEFYKIKVHISIRGKPALKLMMDKAMLLAQYS